MHVLGWGEKREEGKVWACFGGVGGEEGGRALDIGSFILKAFKGGDFREVFHRMISTE